MSRSCCSAFQIDQQVAATEQVELGEGRILDHAVHGKHHFLADDLLHLETAAFIRILGQKNFCKRSGVTSWAILGG
jgi:hypothetical protein